MTFAQIKERIRRSLNDLGVTFYSTADLDDSVQDAYNLICARSRCITKKSSAELWIANLSYYNLTSNFAATDILGVTAIFNNVTNRFIDDDITKTQANLLQDNWELATGTPRVWIPVNFKYIAIFPRYTTAAGTFDLFYWATAPTVVDTATPLIAAEMQKLIEFYCIPDLLEQNEEFIKANGYWSKFFELLDEYTDQCQQLAKTDLLMRL